MTEQNEEWGPWIEHDGKGCPLPFGSVAEVTEKANEDGDSWNAGDERTGVVVVSSQMIEPWYRGQSVADIIRYRIRKPRALSKLQEMIRNLPERIDA